MRKIFTLVAAILLAVTVWAQSGCPQKMSYQAVVRNAANELVTNTTGITVEIMISDGTISYSETHTVSSNQNGLISFMIGQDGTDIQGTMDNLDWANANMTTTVTVPDELPVVTTTEVVAVPYALYACEINPDGVNITKIKTDIYNHIQDTLSNYYTKAETDNKYETKAALCDDVIACVDGKLADGSSTTNNAIDTIVKNIIASAEKDSLITTRELTDSLSNYKIQDCEDVITCVDNAIADGSSTTNNAIDTIVKNNVLTELQDGTSDINHTVDTIVNNQIVKAAADSLISTRELTDSLSNYTETSKLCEYITTNCTDIALDSEIPTVNNSTITIKQGDSNLGSFTLNQEGETTITIPTADAQAQSDWAQTDDTKADYIKNKPNIEKIVRDSLVNGNSAINSVVDTIVNNQIVKAAADSLISTRELTDSLSNYKIQDCEDVITCVDNAIADGSSTTNNAIDTIVKNNVLTELQDGTSDINHTVDTIVNNQIMKAAADSLISTRELTDSLSN
ncbi:MAG: hypothetical protein MJZ87_00005, partial [Bacteroidales bacterium]|nr:hypothetical protein [Bacteroidales bacterium]